MKHILTVLMLVGFAAAQTGAVIAGGLTYGSVVDAEASGTGTDGAAKIASIIASSSLCPSTGNNIGCIIDARGITGTDLVFKSNPFHGSNRSVVLLLGNHTYVACVPWVSGQSGYMIMGVDAPASVVGGTHIRSGTATDGCAGTFPNGASQLVFTWQHGLYPAATYAALYNDCGDPTTDSPTGVTADCFGGEVWNTQFDCSDSTGNPVSTCNFGYFTAASEERGGLHNVSVKNPATACGFWDRSTQIGPPSPGGSGPVHFGLWDTTCTPSSTSDLTVDGWVAELNSTTITFTGQSGCTAATNPAASGVPTAYTTISAGIPVTPAIITNAGNCTTPPTACVLNSGHPTGFVAGTCTVTSAAPVISTVTFGGSPANYPTAAVPGGGPIIIRSTITGSGATNRIRNAIAIEGDRDTVIEHIHTERVGDTGPPLVGNTILHGFGTAPYSGGTFIGVNTTSGVGGCVHYGVGALSLDYAAIDITREISNGCTIQDDNVNQASGGRTLGTGDTPSHRRVPFYTPSQGQKVTLALATAAIGAHTCAAAQTATLTGVLPTSTIKWSFASTPIGVTGYGDATTPFLTVTTFATANTANVVVCNVSGAAITPGAITVNLGVDW